MKIEPLEARVAPAAVFQFTDADGDQVKVTTSKGTDAQLAAAITLQAAGLGSELQLIDFSLNAAVFAGTNLKVTAKRSSLGGDGFANLGAIDASADNGGGGIDLGFILVRGDLAQIDAGDTGLTTPAVKGITANSMGQFGLATQGILGSLESTLIGPLGFLKVAGNVHGVAIEFDGSGAITIGGSFIGSNAISHGSIQSSESIGPIKIGGSLEGASANLTGSIRANTTIGSVTIGGSVKGGAGNSSGLIFAFDGIGPVKVGGSIVGGAGISSGAIRTDDGTLAKVTVGGSLIGGSGADSGLILSDGAIGAVKIGGSVIGNGEDSGRIDAGTTLRAVTVGGSVTGGTGSNSGKIFAGSSIGKIKIIGSLVGNDGSQSGSIRCNGTIAGVDLGGAILGGDGTTSGVLFGSGGIGPVKIGGDLIGGTALGAGAISTAGALSGVRIGGSLLGGTATFTGYLSASDGIGAVKIIGNLEGGNVSEMVTVEDTGVIRASRLASLFVGGSIISGVESGGGTLIDSGAVRVTDDIGSIVVKGSIVGSTSNPVLITARGSATASGGKDVAIGSITVDGHVAFANILAGYDLQDIPVGVNADAQIGRVIVGDWIASNLVAGVQDDADAAFDDEFGDGNDQLIAGGSGTIARIASILIRRSAVGSLTSGTDTFGFVAQQIGSFKVGSTIVPLAPGPSSDLTGFLLGIGEDLWVREV